VPSLQSRKLVAGEANEITSWEFPVYERRGRLDLVRPFDWCLLDDNHFWLSIISLIVS